MSRNGFWVYVLCVAMAAVVGLWVFWTIDVATALLAFAFVLGALALISLVSQPPRSSRRYRWGRPAMLLTVVGVAAALAAGVPDHTDKHLGFLVLAAIAVEGVRELWPRVTHPRGVLRRGISLIERRIGFADVKITTSEPAEHAASDRRAERS